MTLHMIILIVIIIAALVLFSIETIPADCRRRCADAFYRDAPKRADRPAN